MSAPQVVTEVQGRDGERLRLYYNPAPDHPSSIGTYSVTINDAAGTVLAEAILSLDALREFVGCAGTEL